MNLKDFKGHSITKKWKIPGGRVKVDGIPERIPKFEEKLQESLNEKRNRKFQGA